MYNVLISWLTQEKKECENTLTFWQRQKRERKKDRLEAA